MMIEHAVVGAGDTCEKCKEHRRRHRKKRTRQRAPKKSVKSKRAKSKRAKSKTRKKTKVDFPIIGIDGEGQDTDDGRHIYTLLSAVDEHGTIVGEVENPNGLSTKECAEMLLGLPEDSLKFVFMGSYDLTKMLEDLRLEDIYFVMHPETRELRTCTKCHTTWRSGEKHCEVCKVETKIRAHRQFQRVYETRAGKKLNLGVDWFNGTFTFARPAPEVRPSPWVPKTKPKRWTAKTLVWDCFKFFQCSFVQAIQNWKIGTPEEQEAILAMKNKRGAFDVEDPANIRTYCRKECELLAKMMRAVIEACSDAGISLQNYYGAGSIASALLKAHEVKEHLGPPLEMMPERLQHAVMSAYFGGRFENVVVGNIREPVHSRDVYSAYPYALSRLPCLACGKWRHVTRGVLKAAKKATLAVVHFEVAPLTEAERTEQAWMPLPFRDKKKSICFPSGFSGWAWLPEFEAALVGWKHLLTVKETWVYSSKCEHQPFAWIPAAYRQRFEWGKDGRGIVMKLGLNACAGKTMQNQGDPPPYKSWIWGGMVTATTRAQVLGAVTQAEDPWNVLAIATDGVFTTEELDLPKPDPTDTEDLPKPLGDWGNETHNRGVFFTKPGMYFDRKGLLMRARGIGRKELHKNRRKLVEAFKGWDRASPIKIRVVSRRFFGARSSVLGHSQCSACETGWVGAPIKRCPKCGEVGDRFDVGEMHLKGTSTPAYGRWAKRPIDIAFEPLPKRERIDHTSKMFGRMRVRDVGGKASMPYSPGQTTELGLLARQATEEALEQPDWSDDD